MSPTKASRAPLWTVLVLGLLAIPFAVQAQEITPGNNILLPYFEVKIHDVNDAVEHLDTTFGLVNASADETQVEFTVYTNWGIPVLQFTDVLKRTEPRAVNLELWIVTGQLPNRTLSEAELAELQAALSGQPSPTDQLYRGTEVRPNVAVGYLIMRAISGDHKKVLWGDSYDMDTSTDYFQGETLVALNDNLQTDCSRHGIRFSNTGTLYEGTELIIWTGKRFEPSPTPQPIGAKVPVSSSFFDEEGNHVYECHREFIAVEVLPVCHLENLPPIGWIDMKFQQPTFVQEHLHSITMSSAQLHAWCLPVDMNLQGGPSIDIEKYINHVSSNRPPGAQVHIGDPLTFEYVVKNTGEVPLHDIEVSDSDGFEISCPKTALEAGEQMTCTARSTALPCSHKNIGSVVGYSPSDHRVVDKDSAWYTADYDASISLEKRVNGDDADVAPGPAITAGDLVSFTFEVTNTGAATLTNVHVTDAQGLTVTCPKTVLEAGESMTCTAPAFAATHGQHDNTATVKGRTPCDTEIDATDSAHYRVPGPAIDVEKTVNGEDADTEPGPKVLVGSSVQFRYVVTNIGDVPLTDVTMEDPDYVTCTSATLAAGASFECGSGTSAQVGQHENIATAHGHYGDQKVEDSDPGHYLGVDAKIDLEKRVNGQDADTAADAVHVNIGSSVAFSYVVTNTGNVELTNISVTDDAGLDVTCPKTTLQPAESMTCTASSLALAGLNTNVGTATGTWSEGQTVNDTDPANYIAEGAAIRIEKLVNGEDADTAASAVHVNIGSQVLFTYSVTNTGDVALTDVAVTDDKGLAVSCPKTTLAVGESMSCTANTTAQAGLQTNVGTATGTYSGGTVTDDDPANYIGDTHPAIDLEKRVNGEDADTAATAVHVDVGSQVQFTYVVTNTGDVSLTNVAVTDDTGLTVTCPKTTLAAGESMTCTASELAVAGLQTNTGTATGTYESQTLTDSDPGNYYGDPIGDQGCTPGYWKNHTDSWPPTGYSTSQKVSSVFDASSYPTLANSTLLQALSFAGGPDLSGAAEILLRAAVAALLNASHPGVSYPRTAAEVISSTNTALVSANRDTMLVLAAALDADNNRGCPLN